MSTDQEGVRRLYEPFNVEAIMANTHAPTANPASKNNGNISCKYKELIVNNHRQIEVSNGGMIEGRTFKPHATRPLAVSL